MLILPYLLCPYESKLYDFCRFFFLYIKNNKHQTLVSFLLLTSIYKCLDADISVYINEAYTVHIHVYHSILFCGFFFFLLSKITIYIVYVKPLLTIASLISNTLKTVEQKINYNILICIWVFFVLCFVTCLKNEEKIFKLKQQKIFTMEHSWN